MNSFDIEEMDRFDIEEIRDSDLLSGYRTEMVKSVVGKYVLFDDLEAIAIPIRELVEVKDRRMKEIEEKAGRVLAILGPCDRYDHNGNCQSHFVENPCSVSSLREALNMKGTT